MVLHPERRRRPAFLVVEGDAELASGLTVFLGRHAPTMLVTSYADALYALSDHDDWSGVVTELRMPDGSGLELLARMRQVQPDLWALVLTSLRDPSLFEGPEDDTTMYSPRPPDQRTMGAFVVAALGLNRPETRRPSAPPGVPSLPPPARGADPRAPERRARARRASPLSRTLPEIAPGDVPFMARAAAVKEEAAVAGLTTREMQVLGLAVEGRTAEETMRALGMDRDAYDGHVRRVLAKTHAGSLDEIGQQLLFDARVRTGE